MKSIKMERNKWEICTTARKTRNHTHTHIQNWLYIENDRKLKMNKNAELMENGELF